jgi:hypothetical protein
MMYPLLSIMTPLPTPPGKETRTTDGEAYSTSSSVVKADVCWVLVEVAVFVAGSEVEVAGESVVASGVAVPERLLQAAPSSSNEAARAGSTRMVGRAIMGFLPSIRRLQCCGWRWKHM